jgi:hypothetical protein
MCEQLSELRFQALPRELSTLWRGVYVVDRDLQILLVDIISVPFQFPIRSMTVD